jgi:hypothetical protein
LSRDLANFISKLSYEPEKAMLRQWMWCCRYNPGEPCITADTTDDSFVVPRLDARYIIWTAPDITTEHGTTNHAAMVSFLGGTGIPVDIQAMMKATEFSYLDDCTPTSPAALLAPHDHRVNPLGGRGVCWKDVSLGDDGSTAR